MHGCLWIAFASWAVAQPPSDDFTPQWLRDQVATVQATYGVAHLDLPLDVKAEWLEWEMWRYHRTPFHQVYNRSHLPDRPGLPPAWRWASDTSTWNGALLAGLSHKYAVTRDRQTLARIAELLEGMHLFFAITGYPGLVARSLSLTPHEELTPAVGPDGVTYHYKGNAAKGTYNQIAGGYAAVMMYAAADLPKATRQMAQDDLTALVLHLVDHNFRVTNPDGKPTSSGDLTPLIGSIGVPFNAQVAYTIVALGHSFPSADEQKRARIEASFNRLRHKHHVYYEDPLRSLVQPQRVGASPFVKGMNDRNHVTNAAFVGLTLELDEARRAGRPIDREFVYQMGQTVAFSMERIGRDGNSLCNFMWAALLANPELFETLVRRRAADVRRLADQALLDGVEQLRHFRLDRFAYPGHEVETGRPLWVDQRNEDDYHWKAPPTIAWQVTGPATDQVHCAIDFLYAYWLFRHFRLEEHPALRERNLAVLAPTYGLTLSPAADGPFLPAAGPAPAVGEAAP